MALALALLVAPALGHGHVTLPGSTRHGGSLQHGGDCKNGACFWFSNNVEIPHEPTLPEKFRTVQGNISGGAHDVTRKSPWRSPGSAPVYGSGCGMGGGSPHFFLNGGYAPKGVAWSQGEDGARLPPQEPVTWTAGAEVEVGWGISANHGGGYSYRLCKADGDVTEACFQRTPLRFAGDTQWLAYTDGRRQALPLTKVAEGTFPAGSEWAMGPVPGCRQCDFYETCGAPLDPVPGWDEAAKRWDEQVNCYAACDGTGPGLAADGSCVPGTEQFPPRLPGLSGFGKKFDDFSIVDKVVVPADLEAGRYLLSWRWDCEESTQVWQNCADVVVVKAPDFVV